VLPRSKICRKQDFRWRVRTDERPILAKLGFPPDQIDALVEAAVA
jgi:hypothetical protein